jgi:branched-chain amino acid transport system permease protein
VSGVSTSDPQFRATGSAKEREARSVRDRSLGRVGAVLLALVVAAAVFAMSANSTALYDADLALLAAVGAIALNLLTGYAGQISIGNAAFLAIGAYMVVFLDSALPFPIPALVGGLAAGAVGFAIGLPSLRLRGLYLIFSTLALQFVVAFAAEQYDSSTGAAAGHFIAAPKLGPLNFLSDRTWFVSLVVVVGLVALFVRNIVRGAPGRAWAAVRANEAAAAVGGVNVTRAKLLAFTASSLLIGIAGGLGAYFLQEVDYTYFSVTLAVTYIAMILIGGLGSIWGSIIGAAIVSVFPFLMQDLSTSISSGTGGNFLQQNLSAIDTAVYGLAILVFLYFRPAGIASLGRPLRRALSRDRKGDPCDVPGEHDALNGKPTTRESAVRDAR